MINVRINSCSDRGDMRCKLVLSRRVQEPVVLSLLHSRVLRLLKYVLEMTRLMSACLECIGCGLCGEGLSQI